MLGAALLAKKAVERGLRRKPWVKTSLAPGSKIVMDYYERAGLLPYLEQLGFHLVGYGCTTCIGNSGPLIPEVAEAVDRGDLAVAAVLSGNRNFEGRINPDVKMNYLASPPLVVAYALAGIDGRRPHPRAARAGPGRPRRVPRRRLAVGRRGRGGRRDRGGRGDVHPRLRGRLHRRRALGGAVGADRELLRLGSGVDLRPQAAVLRRDGRRAGAGRRHQRRPGAGQARRLGDHRPHLPRRGDQDRQPGRPLPGRARGAASGLQLLRLPARQPRGDDPRHVRQHPAAQPARPGHRGRLHPHAARRRGDDHLRRGDGLRRAGHAAGDPGRRRVRLGLVAGLGREGHRSCSASAR